MNTTDKRHTFHLCIEEDETTTLDIMVRAGDTPEDITKAKKTILKMLADYTPAAKKAAPVPPAEVEAPAAPGPEEEARASAPDAGAQMPPESDAPPQGSGALEQKTLEGVRGLLRLRCPECGSNFVRFLKERQRELACRCGHCIDLTVPLTRYQFTCPYCEKEYHGLTNLEDLEITARCKCGGDVDLTWVPKLREYRN